MGIHPPRSTIHPHVARWLREVYVPFRDPVVTPQIMAIEHKELPFTAVQFHPESILTDPNTGLTILANCFRHLRYDDSKDGP